MSIKGKLLLFNAPIKHITTLRNKLRDSFILYEVNDKDNDTSVKELQRNYLDANNHFDVVVIWDLESSNTTNSGCYLSGNHNKGSTEANSQDKRNFSMELADELSKIMSNSEIFIVSSHSNPSENQQYSFRYVKQSESYLDELIENVILALRSTYSHTRSSVARQKIIEASKTFITAKSPDEIYIRVLDIATDVMASTEADKGHLFSHLALYETYGEDDALVFYKAHHKPDVWDKLSRHLDKDPGDENKVRILLTSKTDSQTRSRKRGKSNRKGIVGYVFENRKSYRHIVKDKKIIVIMEIIFP